MASKRIIFPRTNIPILGGTSGSQAFYDSKEKVIANFSYSIDGQEVTFTDLSSSNKSAIKLWSWDFGDGATSTEQNPVHTYLTSDTFLVILKVVTSSSAEGESGQQILVEFGLPIWDGATPTFAQGDAVETGSGTLFALDTDLAKSTKDRTIIGNRGYDIGGADIGAAHIYLRVGSDWILEQTLQRSGALADDKYGSAVAINGDGTIAIVANSGNITAQENIEVWTRAGTTWSRIQTITTTFAVGSYTNSIQVSSDGGFLCLRNNSSFGIIEGWRWDGAQYVFEFDFTEPSNTNAFAESFWISEDGLFVGANRQTTFFVWENTSGSIWDLRPAGTGAAFGLADNGFGMSNDARVVAIAHQGGSNINTWEWDGAAYQKITVNFPVTFPTSARMSSDGFQILTNVSGTANIEMLEGDGDVPYVSSGIFIPDDPEQSGSGWVISYDGTMVLVGNEGWKNSNDNQGRFFTLEV